MSAKVIKDFLITPHGKTLSYALVATVLFAVVSSKFMYKFTRDNISDNFANEQGCPTDQGMVFHAFVFFILFGIVSYGIGHVYKSTNKFK